MQYVPVPVPEDRVEEIMRVLLRDSAKVEESGRTRLKAAGTMVPAGLHERSPHNAEMPDDDVRAAYHAATDMGTESKRRRLFEHLAEHPDEVLSYEELSQSFGWDRGSLPGVVSAYVRSAKNRYDNQRPFRIYDVAETDWYMSMDERVAEIIRDEAPTLER